VTELGRRRRCARIGKFDVRTESALARKRDAIPGSTQTTEGKGCAHAERAGGVGRLIREMTQTRVLLAAEECPPSAIGARVLSGDKFTITDGPFAETKELVGAMCPTPSKVDTIEWTNAFLPLRMAARVRFGGGSKRTVRRTATRSERNDHHDPSSLSRRESDG
jgi:hypothetical protein